MHRRHEYHALSKYTRSLWSQGRRRYAKEEADGKIKIKRSSYVWDFKVMVADNGYVYIRKQEWLPIPSTTPVAIPSEPEAQTICCHVNATNVPPHLRREFSRAETALAYHKAQGEFKSLLNRSTATNLESLQITPKAFLHGEANDNWAHFRPRRCTRCPTEYRIDFGVVNKSLLAIVLTKWMCLGTAANRTSSSSSLWVKHRDPGAPLYDFVRGNIFEKYEGFADQRLYRPM